MLVVKKADNDPRKDWNFSLSKMSARDFNRCLEFIYSGILLDEAEPNDDPIDEKFWDGTVERVKIEIAALYAQGVLNRSEPAPIAAWDTGRLPVYVDLFEFIDEDGALDLHGDHDAYKLDQLAPILSKYDFTEEPAGRTPAGA